MRRNLINNVSYNNYKSFESLTSTVEILSAVASGPTALTAETSTGMSSLSTGRVTSLSSRTSTRVSSLTSGTAARVSSLTARSSAGVATLTSGSAAAVALSTLVADLGPEAVLVGHVLHGLSAAVRQQHVVLPLRHVALTLLLVPELHVVL